MGTIEINRNQPYVIEEGAAVSGIFKITKNEILTVEVIAQNK